MPSISQRLGLVKPSRTDPFVTADIANNWQKIDDAPGAHICTSTTRPTWGAGQAGRLIIENDTKLMWRWTGTVFERTGPSGVLRKTDGNYAHGVRSTDYTTTSGTFVSVLSITNVVVPAGGRPVQVVVNHPRIRNSLGVSEAAIFRSATSNGTPLLDRWPIQGWDTSRQTAEAGSGNSRAILDMGLAPGTYNYSFQIRSWSDGAETLLESGSRSVSMYIVEV